MTLSNTPYHIGIPEDNSLLSLTLWHSEYQRYDLRNSRVVPTTDTEEDTDHSIPEHWEHAIPGTDLKARLFPPLPINTLLKTSVLPEYRQRKPPPGCREPAARSEPAGCEIPQP